jgi:hypothetical protein
VDPTLKLKNQSVVALPQKARPNVKNNIDNCGPTSSVMIEPCRVAFNET